MVTAVKRRRALAEVDRLASLKAQIAELEVEAKKITAKLKDRGPGEYLGKEFIATVRVEERVCFDQAKAKNLLGEKLTAECSTLKTVEVCSVRKR